MHEFCFHCHSCYGCYLGFQSSFQEPSVSASSLTIIPSLPKESNSTCNPSLPLKLKQEEADNPGGGGEGDATGEDNIFTGEDRPDLDQIPDGEQDSDGDEVFVPALQSPMLSRSFPIEITVRCPCLS